MSHYYLSVEELEKYKDGDYCVCANDVEASPEDCFLLPIKEAEAQGFVDSERELEQTDHKGTYGTGIKYSLIPLYVPS